MGAREQNLIFKKLLSIKHRGDALFFEVCDGGEEGKVHRRMDAVVFKNSWIQPDVITYEFKTSRADFFGDNKWGEYLKFCSHFYFVTPAGLVKKTEVPDPAGLMCPTSTGTMLRILKKAKYRPIAEEDKHILFSMMKIIILNQIDSEHLYSRARNKAILEKMEEAGRRGWALSYDQVIGDRARKVAMEEKALISAQGKIKKDEELLDIIKEITEGKVWKGTIEKHLRETLSNEKINIEATNLRKRFSAMEESIRQLADILTAKEDV